MCLCLRPGHKINVTRLEVEYGLHANPGRERTIGKVVRSFCDALETLPFDATCADRGAEIRAALRVRGTFPPTAGH